MPETESIVTNCDKEMHAVQRSGNQIATKSLSSSSSPVLAGLAINSMERHEKMYVKRTVMKKAYVGTCWYYVYSSPAHQNR